MPSNSNPIGSEFLVNSETINEQITVTFPGQTPPRSVAIDQDGDFVVVWTSFGQDGEGYGIYAQRFNASGVAQGTEFRVNTTTAGDQQHASVAMDSDGDFVVLWESYESGKGYDIYAQRYSAAGVAQGTEFQINSPDPGAQRFGSVAMDADGDFVSTWSSLNQDGDGYGIYAQRYSAAGVPQGGEFRVNTTTANNQRNSSVAMDAAGNFVIAWTSIQGSQEDIFLQLYDRSGTAIGSETRANVVTIDRQQDVSVAMDADGDFVVTWSSLNQDGDSWGIYARCFSATGVPKGSEFRVNSTATGAQQYSSVSADQDGNFIITWSNINGGSRDVFARRFNAAGVAQSSEYRVNTTTAGIQQNSAIALDADGDAVTVWTSPDADARGIFAQRFQTSKLPSTTGIADLTVPENSPDVEIDLLAAFSDRETPPAGLNYSIVLNSNPGLFEFGSPMIAPTGRLVLDFNSLAYGTGSLTIRATDPDGLYADANFNVTVTAVDDPPVLTTTSTAAAAFTENGAAVAIDPNITATDPDNLSLQGATVNIVNSVGGQDLLTFTTQPGITGSFMGGTLTLSGSASIAAYQAVLRSVAYANTSDTPDPTNRTIDFRVFDGNGYSNTISRTVTVTPVNDAPTLSPATGTVTYVENDPAVSIAPILTLSDPDNLNLSSATVRITNFVPGEDDLSFVLQPGITGSFANGTLALNGSASIAAYEAVLQSIGYVNRSDHPTVTPRAIQIQVSDGTDSSAAITRTVNLTAVNDPPVLTVGSDPLTFTENGAAVAIDPTLTVTDLDNTNLTGATVRISANYAAGQDFLNFSAVTGITGSFSNGVLTLTGSAPFLAYQTVLRSVTYVNSSDNPSPLVRTLQFQVNDGTDFSNVGERTISVTAINDAPSLVVAAGSVTYTERALPLAIDSTITVADVDDATLEGAIVRITNFVAGQDLLSFTDQPGITGTLVDGTLTLSGTAAIGAYQAVLRSVRYSNSSNTPSTTPRSIEFLVNDGELNSNISTRTVQVVAIDDVPSVIASSGTVAYIEGAPAVAIDPGVTLSDPDSPSLSGATVRLVNFVAGEDSLSFTAPTGITGTVSGAVLTLTGLAAIEDYQTALQSVTYRNSSQNPTTTARSVEFRVSDGTTSSSPATREITVVAVNNAPVLTNTGTVLRYVENAGAVAIDPGLTIGDVDSATLTGATVQISNFVAGEDILNFTPDFGITGSLSNGVLTLSGTTTLANYQTVLRSVTYTNSSDTPTTVNRAVEFQVTDAGGASSTLSARTMQIEAAPEAPVVTPATGTLAYTEGAGAVAIDPTIALSDADSPQLSSATVRISNFVPGQDVLGFTPQAGITGSVSNGVLTLAGTAAIEVYQAVLRSVTYRNSSSNPDPTPRLIEFVVNDGGLNSNIGSRTVQVTPVNTPPVVIASSGAVNYVENATGVAIDPGLTVSDADSPQLNSATVRIANFVAGQDSLSFTPAFGITGSFADGVLTLTGAASLANYQIVLRSVTYSNSSDAPIAADRTIEFQLNDGTALSNIATRTVTVTSTNDSPVVTPAAGAASFTEGGAPSLVDANLLVSDVDSVTLTGATVTIANYVATEDSLSFTPQTGITGSFSSGTLILTGTAAIEVYQAVLRSVTYRNSSSNPVTTTRSIGFQVNDGTSLSNVGSRSVQIISVNSPPVLTATAGSVGYTENAPGVAIDARLLIADADSPNLASAIVRISNFVAGEDVLSFTPQFGITGSLSNGILTLTGTASLAAYQTILRSVTYANSSDTPTVAARSIEFQVNDEAGASNVVSRSVDITAVNDAPTIAPAAGAVSFTEKGAAIGVTGGLTLADPDSPNLASATVRITNFVAGEDLLDFTPQAGINSSFSNGALTFSGTAPIATYQTLLRSVTYRNSSSNPNPGSRNLLIQINDGQLDSAAVTRTVQIITVNDPPIVTTSPTAVTYTENTAPVAIDPGLTISDIDSVTLSSATVAIGNYTRGQDVLSFTHQLGITGNFNEISGVLTLSGVAAVANYQTALRSVTYRNRSENPNLVDRSLQFIVSDGISASSAASRLLKVVGVNDAPSVITTGSLVEFNQTTGAIVIDDSLFLSDIDSPILTGATITLSNFVTQDVLNFQAQAGITGIFDAATGRLTLTGSAPIAAYQAALRSVTYNTTSLTPDTTLRIAEFQINDGIALSPVAARSIQITFNSTPPVLDLNGNDPGTGFTTTYVIGSPPVRVTDTDLTLTDVDSPTLTSAVVVIANPLNLTEERLDVTTAGTGIRADYNVAASRLTLIGTASRTLYQQVLGSITYSNRAAIPDLTTRSIVFTVNDGDFTSELSTSIVNLRSSAQPPMEPDGRISLVTTSATDRINAPSSDDTIISTLANLQQSDTIDGGSGIDTLMLMDGVGTVTVDVSSTVNQMTGITPATTQITNFERFDFSRFLGTATMIGSDALDDMLIGGAGNDVISGGAGDDLLMGNGGNDVLDGGSGSDTLIGGSNDDLYRVDSPTDRLIEEPGAGIDSVESECDFVLAANLENLTLVGTAVAGTGNRLNNTLVGNTLSNRLVGRAGNDVLLGNNGNDTLIGGAGNDQLTGGSGRDKLIGGAGKDSFYLTSARKRDRDTIVDFNAKDDTIFVSQSSFSRSLKVGQLASSQFTLGASAADRDDRFIYNRRTGALFFDADGLGGVAQVQIAVIRNRSLLTRSDIVVIAN
jgi:Ca2+-binding RTX toxin-like protein